MLRILNLRLRQRLRRDSRSLDSRATLASRAALGLILLFAIAFPRSSSAQAAADVQAGKVLFGHLCVTCHGVDGGGGAGPPLNRAKLLNAPDDAALRTIIADGIPARGMPRVRRTLDFEQRQLVAYVRSLGRTARPAIRGNAMKGTELYAKLNCAACHIVKGQGGTLGPELTDIGVQRGPQYLRQSLVEPGAVLPNSTLGVQGPGYSEFLPVRVVMKDGAEVRGIRVNEDLFSIQVRDLSGKFHSIRKTNAEVIRKEPNTSLMPSFAGKMSDAELDDLVAYLSSLGGA
jgi:putative heme-binding domain-containing protein